MNWRKNKFVIVVLLVVVCVLGRCGWEWAAEREWKMVSIWRGWQGEAKNDDYYLAKKLLERHGGHLTVKTQKAEQWTFADVDVVVLGVLVDDVSDEQRMALQTWVENGGRLIVEQHSTIAEKIGVVVEEKKPETKTSSYDASVVWSVGQQRVILPNYECVSVSWQKKTPLAQAETSEGCSYGAMWQLGKGELVALSGQLLHLWRSSPFRRSVSIYERERATVADLPIMREGAAGLVLALAGEGKRVMLIEKNLPAPPKFAWHEIVQRWWATLLVFLFAVIAGIWRFGTRFGAMLPDAIGSRGMNWERHFLAAGRFLDEHDARYVLLNAARQRVNSACVLPSEERLHEWAAGANVPFERVKKAFTAGMENEQDWLLMMADLEAIRVFLER